MDGTLRAVSRWIHPTGSCSKCPTIRGFAIVGFFLMAAMTSITSLATAATVRLPATDDSYINNFDGNTVFGMREYIVLGEYHATHVRPPGPAPRPRIPREFSASGGCQTFACLKFGIPASAVPAGATILSAKLKLCASVQPARGRTEIALHHLLTDEWSEQCLCWANQPSDCCPVVEALTSPEPGSPWCTWNVLDLVAETLETHRFLSVMLKSSGPSIVFNSSEASGDQPYLEIEYQPAPPNLDEPMKTPRRHLPLPTLLNFEKGGVLDFAIGAVRPNPSVDGRFSLAISLPDATPARVEVLDLAGRRITAQSLTLGAGRHVVPVEMATALAPGVYVIRLSQGARSVIAKAAVVP